MFLLRLRKRQRLKVLRRMRRAAEAQVDELRVENATAIKFCGECGKPLSEARKPSPQDRGTDTAKHLAEGILAEQVALEARSAAEGERKTITALFADIKGSMELIEGLDPEDARSIIDPALQLMIDLVHRYEGYVAQSTGDGIVALFGAPIAQEDHSRRAVHTALRMQEEIRRYSEKLRADKGLNLEIRVGVNTGEVVVRSIRKDDLHTDYVPVGHSHRSGSADADDGTTGVDRGDRFRAADLRRLFHVSVAWCYRGQGRAGPSGGIRGHRSGAASHPFSACCQPWADELRRP
jgi:hypothetical protein